MLIVIDENIPFGSEAFSTLGEVVTRPGREISRADVKNAEVLCVRSVTRVDAELLEGTAVRYVATATIGTDHLDTAYLDQAGIRYCSAPGCNANSVADYITVALLAVAEKQGTDLEGKTIGVVGCGNVGSRVVKRCSAMGMKVIENDPPLARRTGDPRYLPLERVFEADYISMHTPLTNEGEDATYHLVDETFLGRMRPEAVLLNTSRGAVVDGLALKNALLQKRIAGAMLDVWENEPTVDLELVDLVFPATPHIAGYSLEGKTNGTRMIYQEVCRWLSRKPDWNLEPLLPNVQFPILDLDAGDKCDESVLREAVYKVYPIQNDDKALRTSVEDDDRKSRGKTFDLLRKCYPHRREFSLTTVRLRGGTAKLAEKFRGITFQVA